VQIDGDYFGKLPMTFHSCPDELQLIMPALETENLVELPKGK